MIIYTVKYFDNYQMVKKNVLASGIEVVCEIVKTKFQWDDWNIISIEIYCMES